MNGHYTNNSPTNPQYETGSMNQQFDHMRLHQNGTGQQNHAVDPRIAQQEHELMLEQRIQQQQQNIDELNMEITSLREQLSKSTKDLARLRTHLLEMEETHTLDTLTKEETIQQLSEQLEEYKKKETETMKKEEEYNRMKNQYKRKEEECLQANQALVNLQNVLEQFQAEHENKVTAEVTSLRKELQTTKQQLQQANIQLTDLKGLSERCSTAESTVRSLQEELSLKTRGYIKLQEEVEPLRRTFEQTMKRLTNFTNNEENLIDKRLITSLIISYFKGQANKNEVLELMAKILTLNDDQKKEIGLTSKGKWSLPFFGGGNGTKTSDDQNLTDLWVDFLLKEASVEQQDV